MSKYIIELREEANMVQAINVTQNGTVYIDAKYVTELKELNSDYINEHYDSLQDEAYQRGFEDGKAVNDKGCEGCKYQANRELTCPCSECANNFRNQWTANDDKIEVGDVVEHSIQCFVVTAMNNEYVYGISKDGTCCYASVKNVHKTGRHFDIDKILDKMKGTGTENDTY